MRMSMVRQRIVACRMSIVMACDGISASGPMVIWSCGDMVMSRGAPHHRWPTLKSGLGVPTASAPWSDVLLAMSFL